MDVVLKVLALAAFIGFIAILGIYVPAWNLVVVLVIVALMAIYDFLIRPWRMRNNDS